jgi:5-methyltetrahydrofolate--homocysteine methyltransferase
MSLRPVLRDVLKTRIVVADGAMGTMLQAEDPTLEDFQGLEGCNEILNVSRPDIVKAVHRKYLEVGCDAIETNTFGANFANLSEYEIPDRIYELAFAGAKLAREVADEFSEAKYVLGSIGPGTKLPTLGHIDFEKLRATYFECAKGLVDAGSDALLIETSQDLLQTKAAIIAAREAIDASERDILLIAQVTVETTGTMLLGSEIRAALTALEPLGIDLIGLNCATGPAEMSEHLRVLSQNAHCGLSVMPNAGLPEIGANGATYPLSPSELAKYLANFVENYGLNLVGGCCGTTPEHLKEVVDAVKNLKPKERKVSPEGGLSSLYQFVPFKQELSYLAIGERTNANGSKAFREAILAEDWEKCVDIAKSQIREGAHLLDLSVDYVGRDGVADMKEIASRFATASTLPIMLDSTEPHVLKAGLEHLGGRSIINSVNFEDGDKENSRFAKIMPLVKEHGAAVVALTIDEDGQARTKDWKLAVAERLIKQLTNDWDMSIEDIMIDCLTFPIATGQEETRRDGIATIEAIAELKEKYPTVQTTLGVSNISFGLKPHARVILNSVFLAEAVKAGLDSAIIHPSKITPTARIPEEQLKVALDLVYDKREYDSSGNVTYDPLTKFLEIFANLDGETSSNANKTALESLPLNERLKQRIIDGEKIGLESDLKEALDSGLDALSIINDLLLDGMKTVGELFGKGEMQLPFVLQSAEVMKVAVAYLEPHMDKSAASSSKGSILLATVKGDVHDIGKNLVDIILSNNGYRTVNIGIKQTINQIIDAAQSSEVDVIGMSGLLVKSTVIMKENLEELTSRGLDQKWPVILGGAALTRSYVEQDLASQFPGTVRYAKDAFEGLDLMDAMMRVKRGEPGATLPPLRERRTPNTRSAKPVNTDTARSDVAKNNPVPKPPFFGSQIVKGIAIKDYLSYLDERALFVGQWGLQGKRDGYEEMAETEGRPRLRNLLNEIATNSWLNAKVVYGYFPCYSEGNDLVIVHHEGPDKGKERVRFSFPRQSRDRRLCLSDFFNPKEDGLDVVAFHVVTMGDEVSKATAKLFNENRYREYLELHGLSVQLTEALAEFWHARIRSELGYAGQDSPELKEILDQGYRGSRYSFGYPACPDISQQVELCQLLEPERIGVNLSEEHQLHPEQSTSAIIVYHPEAKYFNAN